MRESLLHGFEADACNKTSESMNWKAAAMLDNAFATAGVERPQALPGIDQLSAVYWFIQNISPPFFFLKRWRDRKTPEQVENTRKQTKAVLEQYLSGWGF
jgi:hypothetical protein